MNSCDKYTKQFFVPEGVGREWATKSCIERPPIWCSVDLRDGNQALVIPMSLEEKLEFFSLLVSVGFKEIEVGFPAASETEYEFCRALIERHLIPDDVTIQVLTQAREHIIARTFEAIDGAPHAIVHLYNSTSVAQREQVFRRSCDEIVKIAVAGARLCRKYRQQAIDRAAADGRSAGRITFEYSPESFTGTEPPFAARICNAVIGVIEPTADDKMIINLPVTVSHSMPHVYADQVEYMHKHLDRRDSVVLSLHPHNDRGCAVADSEMGLLAGADRIEGTLFGNGERTGNVDIITLALNMYSQGVDPRLDFSDLPRITKVYERVTRMHVYERQPYSGALVFAAFSGSHQDAIAKGMRFREGKDIPWTVPYLPIDPTDVGRVYESDVIRINSQSGKGGIGYIMETRFSLDLPPRLRESFGYHVKSISDHGHRELSPDEVHEIFMRDYVNRTDRVGIIGAEFTTAAAAVGVSAEISVDGRLIGTYAEGNGRLDCLSGALRNACDIDFTIDSYTQHALEGKSSALAASYVSVVSDVGTFWGCGIDSDVTESSTKALVSAVNAMLSGGNGCRAADKTQSM